MFIWRVVYTTHLFCIFFARGFVALSFVAGFWTSFLINIFWPLSFLFMCTFTSFYSILKLFRSTLRCAQTFNFNYSFVLFLKPWKWSDLPVHWSGWGIAPAPSCGARVISSCQLIIIIIIDSQFFWHIEPFILYTGNCLTSFISTWIRFFWFFEIF